MVQRLPPWSLVLERHWVRWVSVELFLSVEGSARIVHNSKLVGSMQDDIIVDHQNGKGCFISLIFSFQEHPKGLRECGFS